MRPEQAKFSRETVGKRIRQYRAGAGHTQEKLGALLDIDQTQISRWERGHAAPTLMQLLHIAEVCGVRPEILVEGLVAPSFEQLTNGLGAEAQAALYTVAKLLTERPAAAGVDEPARPPNEIAASAVRE